MNELNMAEHMAEALLNKAQHKGDFILWEIEKTDASNNKLRKYDFGLENGMAGIVLLFGELYKATKKPAYLEVVQKSVEGLDYILKKETSADFGLAHGQAGVILLYCRLFTITKDGAYLQKALNMSEACNSYLINTYTNDSLLEGRAGLAWVLMQLYNLTEDEATMVRLSTAIRILLWNSKNLNTGLSWYLNQTQSGPILGWGYGTAGISHILYALNQNSKDKGLNELLSKTQDSIAALWDENRQNWPDHRIEIDTAEKDRVLTEKMRSPEGKEEILQGKDAIDFRNGTLGILNYLLQQKSQVSNPLRAQKTQALNTVLLRFNNLESPEDFHVLLDLLKKADHSETDHVREAIMSRLAQVNSENTSLAFGLRKGLAGWAYLATRLHSSEEHYLLLSDSSFPQRDIPLLSSNITDFDRYFPLYQSFPATTGLFSEHALGALKEKLSVQTFCTLDTTTIEKCLEEQIDKVTGYDLELLTDAFELEKAILRKKEDCLATVLTYINKVYFFENNRKLQELDDDALLNVAVQFRPSTEAYALCFDATLKNIEKYRGAEGIEKSESYFLLTPTDSQDLVRSIKLPELDELIVHFQEAVTGIELHEALCEELEMEDDKIQALKERIIDLILAQVLDGTIEKA